MAQRHPISLDVTQREIGRAPAVFTARADNDVLYHGTGVEVPRHGRIDQQQQEANRGTDPSTKASHHAALLSRPATSLASIRGGRNHINPNASSNITAASILGRLWTSAYSPENHAISRKIAFTTRPKAVAVPTVRAVEGAITAESRHAPHAQSAAPAKP